MMVPNSPLAMSRDQEHTHTPYTNQLLPLVNECIRVYIAGFGHEIETT